MKNSLYRVLGINGSLNPSGPTGELLQSALAECERVKQGTEVSCVELGRLPYIMPYRGYGHTPDLPVLEILSQMVAADAVIFATPVHWQAPSSSMKLLIDNMTYLELQHKLDGKVAGIIAHCDVDGGFIVTSQLAGILNHMGFAIPPYGTFFKNSNIKRISETEWMWRDIKLLATNVMQTVSLMAPFQSWKWNNEG